MAPSDPSLTKWEVFIGGPHVSVTGLPAGTFQSNNVTEGTPLGLSNDLKKVFTTLTEDGATVLHISGEINGCITTKADYSNYRFETDFKWGERKWEPRLKMKRNNGILYHSQGDHGAFWSTLKRGIEYQVQETDFGDLFLLGGPKAQSRFRTVDTKLIFDAQSPWSNATTGIQASPELDKPHGEWNHLEVYVLGDSAIHVVDGIVVMALTGATDSQGQPLTSGQIQIQSEGAECFYKNTRIAPITAFPKDLATKAGFGPLQK